MSNRTTVLGSRYSVSKILTQIPLTGDVRTIANSHETNRQNVVKTILVHIFLMAKYRMFPGVLTVGAAESQYLSATDVNQAAHCAPGQMFYNGTAIQKMQGLSEYLEITLDCLFGVTDDIHSNFNKADSSAEDNGLRDAFCDACNRVVQLGRFARFERAYQFLPHIDTAFALYKTQGITAFDNSITRQRALIQGTTGDDLRLRNERIVITQTYQNTLRSARNSTDTVMGLDAEDVWREMS